MNMIKWSPFSHLLAFSV